MNCPLCKKHFKHPLDTFSITQQKRCVDCQSKFVRETGYEAGMKKYRVNVSIWNEYDIYAHTHDQAENKARELFDYDIDIDNAEYEINELAS